MEALRAFSSAGATSNSTERSTPSSQLSISRPSTISEGTGSKRSFTARADLLRQKMQKAKLKLNDVASAVCFQQTFRMHRARSVPARTSAYVGG